MLVLGRKVGDEILIGDNIRLVVVAIRGKQVRLGFEAPQQVLIRRREIDDRCPDVHQVPVLEVPQLEVIENAVFPAFLHQLSTKVMLSQQDSSDQRSGL